MQSIERLPTKPTTKPKGFSLIELLIALVIIGVLATFAVPAYNNYIIKAKVSEVNQVASNIGNKIIECMTLNNFDYNNCNTMQYIELETTSFDNIAIIEAITIDSLTAVYTIQLQNTGSSELDAAQLQYQVNSFNQNFIKWQCEVSSATLNKFVPQHCKVD